MSFWTYINGTITVSPFGRTQSEKRYVLETVLCHLPKVTGSEGNMDIYILQKNGYNSYSSHNEFGVASEMRIQNQYIIILNGSLRDRTFEETFKELNIFLNRLAKRVNVEDILVSLKGYDKEFIFKNKKPYENMYECPSWVSDGNEPAWWEYLVWKEGFNTSMPIDLEYKYYNNPENDAEYKRRKSWEKSKI